jgi:SAM-dependent methyltransferase
MQGGTAAAGSTARTRQLGDRCGYPTAVASDGYERRIGRYGATLADGLIGIAGVRAGQRVLDVGAGSGALTAPLARRLGATHVRAIDPDAEALSALRERLPRVEARVGRAEELPYADGEFDATLAQLVVGLVDDAPRAAREMRRVTRAGGVVATCVWDFAEGMTVLRAFWDAARAVAPDAAGEHDQAQTHRYSTPGELDELWRAAGLISITSGALVATARYRDFDDLWEPLAIPDGAPGVFLATLDRERRMRIRDGLHERLGRPRGGFDLDARAWYVRGEA